MKAVSVRAIGTEVWPTDMDSDGAFEAIPALVKGRHMAAPGEFIMCGEIAALVMLDPDGSRSVVNFPAKDFVSAKGFLDSPCLFGEIPDLPPMVLLNLLWLSKIKLRPQKGLGYWIPVSEMSAKAVISGSSTVMLEEGGATSFLQLEEGHFPILSWRGGTDWWLLKE